MAARGENEHAEARTSNTIWPPSPTGPAPPMPTPHSPAWLIHLPLSPFLAPFALPKWARSAFNNLFIAIVGLLMESQALLVGKIVVGLSVFVTFASILILLTWAFSALLHLIDRCFGKVPERPSTTWQGGLSAAGGWMGMVPNAVFLVWGLLYLADERVRWVNRVALIVWASWFLLGCGAALVNGTKYWLREWRTSRKRL